MALEILNDVLQLGDMQFRNQFRWSLFHTRQVLYAVEHFFAKRPVEQSVAFALLCVCPKGDKAKPAQCQSPSLLLCQPTGSQARTRVEISNSQQVASKFAFPICVFLILSRLLIFSRYFVDS